MLHTVWKLLANNGSIIFRIVTKQDLLVQRIITPNSQNNNTELTPPAAPPQIPAYCSTAFRTLFATIFQKHLYSSSNSLQQTPWTDQACFRSFGQFKQTNKQTFSAFLKWNRNKSILFYRSANLPINEEEKAESCTYSNSQPTAESWEFENTKALLTIQPFCASTLAAV